jgi:hypothetical protein
MQGHELGIEIARRARFVFEAAEYIAAPNQCCAVLSPQLVYRGGQVRIANPILRAGELFGGEP